MHPGLMGTAWCVWNYRNFLIVYIVPIPKLDLARQNTFSAQVTDIFSDFLLVSNNYYQKRLTISGLGLGFGRFRFAF